MGGYGFYIWTTYGLAAIVLGALMVASVAALRQRQRDLALLQQAVGRHDS